MQVFKSFLIGSFFIISILPLQLRAQQEVIDSLKKIANDNTGEKRIDVLIKIARKYVDLSDEKEFKTYLSLSQSESKKINYKKGIGAVNNLKGIYYHLKSDYPNSMLYHKEALRIRSEIKDSTGISSSLNNIALSYLYQRNYKQSIEYHLQALAIREALGDQSLVSTSLNNLGNAYLEMGNYLKAIEYLQRSNRLAEQLGDKVNISYTLSNISTVYRHLNNYVLAKNYLQRAIPLFINLGDMNNLSEAYLNMGIIFKNENKISEAEMYFNKALATYSKINSQAGIANTLQSLGSLNKDQGKLGKAIDYYTKSVVLYKKIGDSQGLGRTFLELAGIYTTNGEYTQARNMLEEVVKIAGEKQIQLQVRDAFYQLSQVCSKTLDYPRAYQYLELYLKLNDSLNNESNTKQINELSANFENEKKENEIVLLTKDKQLKEKSFREQRIIRFSLIGGLALLFILLFVLFNRYRFKQQANSLLENQKKEIEKKNTTITDSIDYARTIQEAILPSAKMFETLFPHSFILYKPKAIVSGDFYWVGEKDNKALCAVADCTGHGVPGAFMSMLGNNILENVIRKEKHLQPSSILNSLNEEIIQVMAKGQERSSVKNGMDIALISIDKIEKKLEYAGAHNSIYIIRNGELIEIKANEFSIGSLNKGEVTSFTNHILGLEENDLIYLFSDGYPDQIGGNERKKFFYQPFRDLLLSICKLEMWEQKKCLDETIIKWKAELEQTDDILIIGIKCNPYLV
ncbi:MAG: tetratricopeptide repeat protein [Bacteroidetes bacterium]|nr:tetratricopeptide repeat protein [Bacteroidota bacterium]